MNEQLLKDLVATAQYYNYDWDIISSKFPELDQYDTQLLKDYVATAESRNYDYNTVNNKFPEFNLRKTTDDEVDVGPIELPQVDVEGSKEEDTWIERTLGKNIATDYLGDLWRAGEQGIAQGATVDEAFDVYKKGKNISDEELRRYIEVSDALDKTGASDEMREYEEIKNKAGGGVWGFMKGMVMTRGQVIPQVIVSSAAAMGRTFFDSEEAALATGTGAALAGTAGSFVPVVGTVTGAIGGAVGGLVGSMETALTLTELLKTELGDKDFNKENIRAILEDEELFEDIKDRALARGATIGAVEGITVGLSRGIGTKLLAKGAGKGKIARQVTGIEMTGGAGGEALGQVVAGQEFDIAEVLMEGVAEAKGVVNVADILAKKEYKINGEKRTRKEVMNKVNNMKPENLAKVQFDIIGDKNLKNLVDQKQQEAIFETQIDERVAEVDRKKLVELEKKRAKAEADTEKKGIFAVADADITLENIEAEIAEVIDKYKSVDRRTTDVKARKKVAQDVRSVWLEKTKAFAEIASEQMGFNPFESFKENSKFVSTLVERVMSLGKYNFDGKLVDLSTMTEEQIAAEANRIADSANQADAVNIPTADGNQAIMINEEAAFKYGALQAGSHEVLHGVMKGALANLKALDAEDGGSRVKNLISDFKLNVEKNLGKNVVKLIEQRLKKSYGMSEEQMSTTDEWFTALSDIIEDEDNNITYKNNKGFFDGIKNKVAGFFNESTPYKNLSIETGEDAFNFMKEYSQNVKEGKLSERMLEFAGAAEDELTGGKRIDTGTREGEVEETKFSKTASDNVQRIYEEKGIGGAMDIIEEFKPITSRIAERRREAPGFDKELLMSEIEIGERGILDLIREYKSESGVPLAAYINKFLPSRAIEASRRVLGEEFVEDIAERTDIAAEEVTTEVKAKPKKKKVVLAERLNIADKVYKSIDKVISDLKLDNITFKTLKNQIPEIIGKLFGILPKKIISGANITKAELQSAQMFINKHADLLISMLPEGATASGTATGVPKVLLKPFYTKTSRAKMAKTGTKAGLAVQVKKPNIDKKQFLEVFGIIDGKPVRTDRNTSARVLALANTLGKMITNQAIRQQAENLSKESITRLKDGKSKVMFSKSKNKNTATTEQIQKDKKGNFTKDSGIIDEDGNAIRQMPKTQALIKTENLETGLIEEKESTIKGMEELWSEELGITWEQHTSDRLNKFLDKHPQYYDMLQELLTGTVARTAYLTKEEFKVRISKTKKVKNTKQVSHKRFEYHRNLTKDEKKAGLKGKRLKDPTGLDFTKTNEKDKFNNFLQFFKDISTHLNTGQNMVDIWLMDELLTHSSVDQNNFFRKAANLLGYQIDEEGKPIMNEKVVEEHVPINEIIKIAMGASIRGNVKDVVPVLKSLLGQMSILETNDPSGNLKASMGNDFYNKVLPRIIDGSLKLKDGHAGIYRLMKHGVNPFSIKLFESNKTIAEEFRVDYLSPKNARQEIINQFEEGNVKYSKTNTKKSPLSKDIHKRKIISAASSFSRSSKNPTKGITVLDFDDTLATTKSLVKFTRPDGTTGTLNAEEYASTYEDLLGQGYTFDFSEFNKVVKGKIAPLFQKALKLQKKFGPENMFILTARPPTAQKAIYDFLKANGLNIPIKNITGLANSTAEAKALWVADKVGEGFNDFYFADDALQNTQAVQNMLNQFDVKSKVQQAKVKFSKSMNKDFNNILEEVTGIESKKRFSAIKARKRGESKGKFRFFIPPSHEDFVGLLYNFIGKGKEGNAHRNFFEQALIRPLNRAYRELNTAKQAIANDYKSLNKQFENVKKKLTKKTPDGDFTYQDAIRVYLWNKHGHKVPGLSETDQQNLVDLVMKDPELQTYAETLNIISKQDKYVAPTESWEGGDIRTDLDDATGRIGREQFFTEFFENADIIFSEENLNKIEAAYGADVVSALKDILYRTKTGRNRPSGQNKLVNQFLNYLNGSVASTMFFNIRSAVLQQMSMVNFINFADNNILAAAKAFANQKQYWTDWATIFNSDFMKQRRRGIKTDVNGAELAATVKDAKNPIQAAIKKLLELGFLPTQIGDNMAIATGGSTFYRNRINTYLKQGLSQKEAESKAWIDFQVLAEATQQSARPDMVSQQQASPLGKVILAFQNVTSQFNRLGKKAFLDIKNRRITPGNPTQLQSDMSNLSRIAYYFAIQNLIFYSLQSALFMAMFDDDEEDERWLKKKERVVNGSIDSVLRGTGVWGAAIATLKNMAIKWHEQREKGYNADESAVLLEMLNVSPPLGIKARKIVNPEKTLNYNKKVIDEMETFDIDNPMWSAVTNYIEATTNIPTNRLYNKTQNVRESLNNQHDALERVLMFGGWSKWNLGVEDVGKSKKKQKFGTKKRKVYKRTR